MDKKGNYTPYSFAKKFNKTQILEVFRKHNAVPETDASKQLQNKKQQAAV